MKIALVEAGHWHAPLYLDGLKEDGIEVVAVSDREGRQGARIAAELGARSYQSWQQLLANEAVDFAFAFGRPVDMPAIGAALIAAGVPFAMEKPCGTSLAEVEALASSARARDHFVAVPFLYRFGPLREVLARLEGALPARFHHMSFRFIGGPPVRYLENGCPWMLDAAQSGGGAMMNLGGHFVDLFALLSGESVAVVTAAMSDRAWGAGIEDYAVATLRGTGGALATIEAGYTFPSDGSALREFSFTLRSARCYVMSASGGIRVRPVARGGEAEAAIAVELGNERYYPIFVADTLARFRAGEAPACGLGEAVEVMRVMELAYRSAAAGGALLETG